MFLLAATDNLNVMFQVCSAPARMASVSFSNEEEGASGLSAPYEVTTLISTSSTSSRSPVLTLQDYFTKLDCTFLSTTVYDFP